MKMPASSKTCILIIAAISPTIAYADGQCDTSALVVRRCIAKNLIDANFVIKCRVVDVVNGSKKKDAADLCQFDCNVNFGKFGTNWAQPQECVDFDGPLN